MQNTSSLEDGFPFDRQDDFISEHCLDNLFTVSNSGCILQKMAFENFSTDLLDIHNESIALSEAFEGISSPATPLLTSWNYLDSITEETGIDGEDCSPQRFLHRRVVSHDDVRKFSRALDTTASAFPSDKSLLSDMHTKKCRHSLPTLFPGGYYETTQPKMGSDFGTTNYSGPLLPPRSLTEPPENSYPLHFIIENPELRLTEPLKRRHSMVMSPMFKCTIDDCEKTFSRQYNLQTHMKSHALERPYVCSNPECGSSFSRCHDLKRHEKIHSKDKPFQCPQCKRAFTRNDALTRHLRLGSCPLMGAE